MSEADERLPAGPPGEKGDPGEHGLSRLQGRAVVVLFLLAVLPGALGWVWWAHEAAASAADRQRQEAAQQRQAAIEQRKWCNLIVTLDQANEAAPKRPAAGTFTAAFVAEIHELRQGLGCEP